MFMSDSVIMPLGYALNWKKMGMQGIVKVTAYSVSHICSLYHCHRVTPGIYTRYIVFKLTLISVQLKQSKAYVKLSMK